jgi:hypothetical protein
MSLWLLIRVRDGSIHREVNFPEGTEGCARVLFFDPVFFLLILIPTIVTSAGVPLCLSRTYAR